MPGKKPKRMWVSYVDCICANIPPIKLNITKTVDTCALIQDWNIYFDLISADKDLFNSTKTLFAYGMRYNELHGRTRKLDAVKETDYMAIFKDHKMVPGLDPGCIITIIAYLSPYMQLVHSLQKVINVNEAQWISRTSPHPLLSWVGSGHDTSVVTA